VVSGVVVVWVSWRDAIVFVVRSLINVLGIHLLAIDMHNVWEDRETNDRVHQLKWLSKESRLRKE